MACVRFPTKQAVDLPADLEECLVHNVPLIKVDDFDNDAPHPVLSGSGLVNSGEPLSLSNSSDWSRAGEPMLGNRTRS